MVSIRTKAFLIITVIAGVITISSLSISMIFAERLMLKTVEEDMRLVGILADNLVSYRINLLKANASTAAQKLLNAPEEEIHAVLREQVETDEAFMAMTIFNASRQITASYGNGPTPPELVDSEYIQRAFAGESVISTSRQDPSAGLVFHVIVPMEDRILSVTIPGMLFSELLAPFVIWKTGHIFIDDETGTVLANPRREWVLNRHNFIEQAKNDSGFEGIAQVVRRMIRQETGVGRFTMGGVERICAYMPITGSQVGWSLGVVAPLEESPGVGIHTLFLISGAIFFGLGFLAAFLASAAIAAPFKRIQEQNFRLEELKEIAQNASEAKSRFLAKMSHEMRTPLNAIIGLSELALNSQDLAKPVEESLDKVYSSGMTLLGIVNDLLDISKIESGQFDLIPVEYDLPSIINDTVNLNIIRIGSKPITFIFNIEETAPGRLYGDELRLKQIFNNFLSNAFKYTKDGTVEWGLSFQEEGETVWLTSTVKDSGIGIKTEDLDRLFSDYSQFDASKNRGTEGTGLGLALTKRLVELMDGSITVESEYGKGSTFTVRLRQKTAHAPPIGPKVAENLRDFRYTAQKRSRNAEMERIQLPYAQVLVVDDVSINLEVARGMMQPYGMRIDTALGGREAVELVREEAVRYDAVFMDHMMPDLDGVEALRCIRELGTDYAKNLPIIILTANALTGNEEMFLGNGFQDFLSKPIDILRLDAVIRRWVRDKTRE